MRLPAIVFCLLQLCLQYGSLHAQQFVLNGRIYPCDSALRCGTYTLRIEPEGLSQHPDAGGMFRFEGLNPGRHKLILQGDAEAVSARIIEISTDSVFLDWKNPFHVELDAVHLTGEESAFSMDHLRAVEGTSIYASKKNEVILVEKMTLNMATNNSRQLFSKVPGLNIWESDGGGLQLGIGSRGLSPNRTSSFNTRQNGYDISADALGYPESYYTPPAEALSKIEVVRGAASLQYGTQFGGMLNFVMKRAPENKKAELTLRQSLGSWGFYNTFNSIGGRLGKFDYYAFYQFKRQTGWRPNSGFHSHNAFVSAGYRFSDKFFVRAEYTYFRYLAQQAGGLTDGMFLQDPAQSVRSRNWFQVNWNLFALTAEYAPDSRTRLNTRFFGLLASRESLGYLGTINRADPMGPRDMITGLFRNVGNETRFVRKFSLLGGTSAFLAGFRLYQGQTRNMQGTADSLSGPDFHYLRSDSLDKSDFLFPSTNASVFSECVIPLGKKWSLTPGLRFEYIRTRSAGYYHERAYDLAGNLIFEETIQDKKDNARMFLLAGAGVSYKPGAHCELYGNFSQNYRAINFSDLRVVNPNLRVDPNLKDEHGFNADLGLRGRKGEFISYDLSVFFLLYRDRIGVVQRSDSSGIYRYRTNVADSRNYGAETYFEADVAGLIRKRKSDFSFLLFSNIAWINGLYFSPEDPSVDGKKVELVPEWNIKGGWTLRYRKFSLSWQLCHVTQQFTDATNAIFTSSAVNGLIPAYTVSDLSCRYGWKFLQAEISLNNLFNSRYFTRRSDAYPGPGILPADPRGLFFTLQAKI